MPRSICICLDYLTEQHKKDILHCAEEAGFEVGFFLTTQEQEASAFVQSAEILFANTPSLLQSAPAGLKWYCCPWAGVDAYCGHEELFANPECILTNSNCYGVTISEHVIMVILMMLRRMPEYQAVVARCEWQRSLPIRSIRGSRFTLLGAGDIGRNVAERLRGMNAGHITAINRSGKAHPAFDRTLPVTELDTVLPETDVLVMALPDTPETQQIMDAKRLALLPQGSYLVNVGRGSALDQQALIEALNSGRLAGAALDVMTPEPLPPEHALWSAKNILLTPHVSGNTGLAYTCDCTVELFCRNLRRYAAGLPLEGIVDRQRGY